MQTNGQRQQEFHGRVLAWAQRSGDAQQGATVAEAHNAVVSLWNQALDDGDDLPVWNCKRLRILGAVYNRLGREKMAADLERHGYIAAVWNEWTGTQWAAAPKIDPDATRKHRLRRNAEAKGLKINLQLGVWFLRDRRGRRLAALTLDDAERYVANYTLAA
jgi:hypothetical protein